MLQREISSTGLLSLLAYCCCEVNPARGEKREWSEYSRRILWRKLPLMRGFLALRLRFGLGLEAFLWMGGVDFGVRLAVVKEKRGGEKKRR